MISSKPISILISALLFFAASLINPFPSLTQAASPTPTNTTCKENCITAGGGTSCNYLPPCSSSTTSPSNTTSSGLKCEVNGEEGVNTALGCISTNIEQGGFVGSLLELAIGLGGGIALLLILYGTFIVTTSAGNPDKLNQGKEIIGSAISGLLFIILSIVLLNLIGVKILAIPGF